MSDVNATPSELRSPFPQDVTPFDPATGRFNQVWLEFFLRMFKRTGGTTGADVSALLTLLQQLQKAIAAIVLVDSELDARENATAHVNVRRPHDSALEPVASMRRSASVAPEALAVARRAAPIAPDPVARTASRIASAPPEPVAILPQSTTTAGDSDDWAQVAKANLPTAASSNAGWRRFVTDATGATVIIPAYSNGSAWVRFSDDSVVN